METGKTGKHLKYAIEKINSCSVRNNILVDIKNTISFRALGTRYAMIPFVPKGTKTIIIQFRLPI